MLTAIKHLLQREINYYRRHLILEAANLEITNLCNLGCVICKFGREKQSSQDELTLNEWKQILDSLICLGVRRINFIGAEPLIRKGDVLQMASYLKGKGIFRKLSTNATLIDLSLAKPIVEAFDEITISLDAPNEKHDEIRGDKHIFSQVCEGIRAIQETRSAQNLITPRINLHATIFNANYNLLEELVNFAERFGVNIVSFQYITQTPRQAVLATTLDGKIIASDRYVVDKDSFFLTEEQMNIARQQLNRIRRRTSKVQISIKPLSCLKDCSFLTGQLPIHRCYVIRNRVIVSSRGQVYLCSHLDYPLGDLKHETLDKIWGNSKHLRLLNSLARNLFPVCAYCCHFSANLTLWQQLCLFFNITIR